MIIAVDATGGEYAPYEIVKGAIKAAQDYKVGIALVGTRSTLHVLASRHLKKLDFSFIEANQIIGPQESPIRAVNNKPNSPIVVGINMVKDGSLLILGKIKGVERPAIASPINIGAVPSLLIDSGANADCRPSHLVQFAHLGTIYSQHVLGIPSPRVGLLSNGEEESKGNRLIQETHQLLKKANLNFIGNIEGQDIAGRKADVIVTDGFTGNIVLKTIEGLGSAFQNLQQPVGQALTGTSRLQGRLLLSIVGLDSWIKRIDYREYGGACLLGVNGNITISHGRSRAKAIKNAIGLAKQTAEGDLCQIIRGESLDRTIKEEE